MSELQEEGDWWEWAEDKRDVKIIEMHCVLKNVKMKTTSAFKIYSQNIKFLPLIIPKNDKVINKP